MEIVFFWLLFAGAVGIFAASRGRSGSGFFLLSVVLSPLLGFLIVMLTPNLATANDIEQQRREEHERQIEAIRSLANSAAPGAAAVAPPSVADEIQKLAALRDSGALTEDEFAAQKAAVLSRGGY